MQTRRFWILLAILLLTLCPLAGCAAKDTTSGTDNVAAAPSTQYQEEIVSATGEVRPTLWANLSFPVGGLIKALHVEEGQQVATGQALMELEAVQLERAVAEAQAALAVGEANLALIKAGAHPQDIAAAEQAVDTANANAHVAETQVMAAEAGVKQAQAGVAIARAHVVIAEAVVKVAQAELIRAQTSATQEEIVSAEAALHKARAAVRLAQTEYDRVGGASNTPQALTLEQATLDLEMAQAHYDRVVAGPRSSDLAPLRTNIETAKAQVALAQAQAEQAKSGVVQAEAAATQARAALEASRAQVGQAQAALDRLKAGATPEEIAVVEATVKQARESLTTTRAMRDQTTLIAPFDGTVGMLNVRVGEEMMPGQVVLILGALSTLRVETTDVDEIDIARVAPGQQVDLTFDALPEQVLTGHVVRVAPMSTPAQAATTYRVIIEFDETHPALRWGMTAFVDIWVDR